jgi:hypothetical protein
MTFYNADPVRFGVGISSTTDSLGVNDPEVGTVCRVGDENYVFVYNAGNSQINPSYGCVMSAVTGYSVTVSSITSVDFLAGVCVNATIATGYYGWLVTKGFATVEMEADNSCAAGQLLTLADNGEFALKSNSTGYPSPAVGKSMEAIASGASGVAYISVL